MKDKLKSILEPIAVLGSMLLMAGLLLFAQTNRPHKNVEHTCFKAKKSNV